MFFVKKSKFKKTTKWFFLLGFILFGFVPFFSFGYTLLQPLPSRDGGELTEDVSLSEYFSWVFEFGLAITAFLAVLMITVGGITYMASGGNESMVTKGKGYITNALYGLLLAFGSYLLLYTINPQLVSFDFLDDFDDNFPNKNEFVDETETGTVVPEEFQGSTGVYSNSEPVEKTYEEDGKTIKETTTTSTYGDGATTDTIVKTWSDDNYDYEETEKENKDGTVTKTKRVKEKIGDGYTDYDWDDEKETWVKTELYSDYDGG